MKFTVTLDKEEMTELCTILARERKRVGVNASVDLVSLFRKVFTVEEEKTEEVSA